MTQRIFSLSIFLVFSLCNTMAETVVLKKPQKQSEINYNGDNQYGEAGQPLSKSIKVRAVNANGEALQNIPIEFQLTGHPNKARKISLSPQHVLTDTAGIAASIVTLGDTPGEYTIAASSPKYTDDVLVYQLTARRSNWVFMLSIGVAGGLALFLLGMYMMSEGLQKSAGSQMRKILNNITKNKWIGTGVGSLATMVFQSSSATLVMLVSFVNSKLMRFEQTIAIILGAGIGTTVTAQLIAFRLADYSLLIVAIGFSLQFFIKNNLVKYIGQSILGFGVLFYGMYVMSQSLFPLRDYEPFLNLLVQLENPFIGILAGAILTAIIQSSGAFIGIMIILASQGVITLNASIPLIIGSNIGTVITAFLASIGTRRSAQKVAIAEAVIKIIGAVVFIGWIPYFADVISWISPEGTSTDVIQKTSEELPRQIANAHTFFNVALALILLPFTDLLCKIINKLYKDKEIVDQPTKIKYLNNDVLQSPSLALNLAKQETMRTARWVQKMLDDIWDAFNKKDIKLLTSIQEREKKIDFLIDNLKEYVIKIAQHSISPKESSEVFTILHTVNEIEQIADIISTNLGNRAYKWIMQEDGEFSQEGIQELTHMQQNVSKIIGLCFSYFNETSLITHQNIQSNLLQQRQLIIEMEKSHFSRLQKENENSIKSSKTHMEVIGMFYAISRHVGNITQVLETQVVGYQNDDAVQADYSI